MIKLKGINVKVTNLLRCSLVVVLLSVLLFGPTVLGAENAKITIQADKTSHRISPLLYGIFFEEINRAGDGGLYAEMVQNRSFEDADKPVAWNLDTAGETKAVISIENTNPLNENNPHYLKFQIDQYEGAKAAVTNEGFKGMYFQKGKNYELSFYARIDSNYGTALINAALINEEGRNLVNESISRLTQEWKQYKMTFEAPEDCSKGKLQISASHKGTIYLDMVSLFPANTWEARSNGLRRDLAEMLDAMKPAFVRFPGGCFVEGNKIANAFRWKETIGDIAQRPGHWNLWGYRSTDGLGYHEYLQMCEDLNSEPLFVINCGMAHEDHVPMDQMNEWVEDALDAIEYANGPVTSTWGALRAKNGHSKPFNLKYIEIGNENSGDLYQERYDLFYNAIKAKYPNMNIVADVITTGRPTEIIDEHYYSNPEFFISNAERYDNYDRKGPKVYVGEYAVTQNCGHGNLRAAIGEAAFMTGMERNSDIVVMASYAPLFVNVDWRQWNPDAINFDSSRCYGTPSYYVQKMFSEARGDYIVPIELQSPLVDVSTKGQIGLGTWATKAQFKDIRILRDNKEVFRSDFSKNLDGWRPVRGDWKIVDNTLEQDNTGNDMRIMINNLDLSDCTIELKARKLDGAEGFLILFRTPDDGTKSWWNIGGWGNTQHAIEIGGIVGKEVPGKIEIGRWYDVRIELAGNSIKCYLDNNIIHDVKLPQQKTLYAVASRNERNNELILKAVNVTDKPVETELDFQGLKNAPVSAVASVLTAPDGATENSLNEPTTVFPQTEKLNISKTEFVHEFPAQSVTVLRFQIR